MYFLKYVWVQIEANFVVGGYVPHWKFDIDQLADRRDKSTTKSLTFGPQTPRPVATSWMAPPNVKGYVPC